MKTILKNKKNRRITGVIVMVCMISFGFVMQGCDNEKILFQKVCLYL